MIDKEGGEELIAYIYCGIDVRESPTLVTQSACSFKMANTPSFQCSSISLPPYFVAKVYPP